MGVVVLTVEVWRGTFPCVVGNGGAETFYIRDSVPFAV
jgi:hypothetical protein